MPPYAITCLKVLLLITSTSQSVAEKEWNKHDSDDSKEISFYLRSAMNEIAELGDIYVLRKKEQALRALDRDLTTVMLDTCKVLRLELYY